jgi:hypothetical protein
MGIAKYEANPVIIVAAKMLSVVRALETVASR